MGAACSICCGTRGKNAYEPLLLENEREAVADLLQYLENRTTTNFFTGSPLAALTTLSFSDNVDLQRSAALAFAEITEKEVREVGRDTLDPVLYLLTSHDHEVQRAASAALGNLAVNAENKLLIVSLGGLEPLIRQMLSPNVEVQCNAVGCVTNLATHDENKTQIAKSGALVPLTRLAKSKDMRVQRNATGALLNMTHSDENRQQLVNAGAIPVLVSLLNSPDTDVQYYCTTALSNIAVDGNNRKKLAQTEPKLVQSLVALMDSQSLKWTYTGDALELTLSSEKYQLEIVKADGLKPLLRLLHSSYLPLILSAAACVRNVSIHPANESPIIDSGFLTPLIELLSFDENEEVQCHAISTLRNLAASSERNKGAIVEAGAVERIKDLVLTVPLAVQSEMTACVAVLALSDDLKPQLLEMGICEVLIPLTNSPSVEVQGNSAAALGNLSSKAAEDYAPFNAVWNKPDGGLHAYLVRFLSSADITFQHIAVWTIVQLLEAEDDQLTNNIRSSPILISSIRQLAASPPPSRGGQRRSHDPNDGGHSDDDFEDDGLLDQEGEGEIAALARRILDLTEESRPEAEDASRFGTAGSEARVGSQGGEHDELRASVHRALSGSRG
ncbi:vacuolar protein 8 [Naematelia encephala]|uniref:Vacuolar protein 8 n=1 Tax=Naematelia encephala TaxID=71784 RepID=A0A1Y2BDD7_9TREE|nr:vacuolar protein 8 [Naematelia encephala]